MEQLLLIVHVIITIALIIVILLQRSSTDGFGVGGSGSGGLDSVMSGRASANLLTKTTAILATLFIVNSLALAVIASNTDRNASITDDIESPTAIETPSEEEEAPVETPLSTPSLPIAE